MCLSVFLVSRYLFIVVALSLFVSFSPFVYITIVLSRLGLICCFLALHFFCELSCHVFLRSFLFFPKAPVAIIGSLQPQGWRRQRARGSFVLSPAIWIRQFPKSMVEMTKETKASFWPNDSDSETFPTVSTWFSHWAGCSGKRASVWGAPLTLCAKGVQHGQPLVYLQRNSLSSLKSLRSQDPNPNARMRSARPFSWVASCQTPSPACTGAAGGFS